MPSIKSVTQTGVVNIVFNIGVLVPGNYSNFDNTTMSLEVISRPSYGYPVENRTITKWIVTGFTRTTMKINITFADPKNIS
jgi:hypothetical protein